ncbi:hypothetical protein BS47DRAFT_1489885 [Hydnum rufescens UP504]|uniref:3-hydroxyisobutyryl-CoA hydrolase n=1 Tax=Hydnum rufescens UP504 TaxID=1448309 RepID=A0A9P6DKP7_9AGAM|nr:hypothetical protein BS47DRAFT_1489885 [Hydnum rufescens UP504]
MGKIIIGRGNGTAFCAGGDAKIGGDVDLPACTAHRMAIENAVFAMLDAKLNAFRMSDPHMSSDGKIGTYLAVTGNSILGHKIRHLGLATHCIPSRRIPSVLERLGQVRIALDGASACKDVESVIAELETFAAPESVREEDRSEVEKWARMTLDVPALRSPTSLKAAFEAIRIAGRKDYNPLQRDLAINIAFAVSTSPPSFLPFPLLITLFMLMNKDPANKRPNWSPSTLEEVSPATARTPAEINLRYYVLPRENDVGAFVLENTSDSGASGVSAEEVVAHFEGKTRGKSGVWFKVKEVLVRRCETMMDGWLRIFSV